MPLTTRPLRPRQRNKTAHTHTQAKVKKNDKNKTNRDNRRTPALVVDALDVPALADLVHAPDVQEETVD
jgi:hypothetical protein